ncbi:MAG: M20/M25/M40 family metallo-hydrolase, partial [Turicibacter sp.]|nr:M20/M25/M40 family metallo-hydrolase [Turicibacter sp.]
LEIIKNIAKKHDVEMNILYAHDCSKITDINNKNYKYVCSCIHDVFEDVKPTPYIMLGGTDSRHYTRICDSVIRFSPLKITNQQLQSVHAIDENISMDALYDAVRFYRYFIENYKG